MTFPANCKYSKDHEWIRVESDNIAYIGISDHAQSELGELVYIEVETVGQSLKANDIFGVVEAVKTTSDLYLPVSGQVLEFNKTVEGDPSIINNDPYNEGWIVKIEMSDPSELDALMDAAAYEASL
jgi:glycine cleavage system H protein